jgi:predicted regulator of Ras-like GTPase activity (Roadblock/LC7/MglB family)
MNFILTAESIRKLDEVLKAELLDAGAMHVLVVEDCGNVIIERGALPFHDILPLAALAAANFGATERMAKLIGEQDFTVMFHKGVTNNIFFTRIDKRFLMICLFGNEVQVGRIRLGSGKAVRSILPILWAHNEVPEALRGCS